MGCCNSKYHIPRKQIQTLKRCSDSNVKKFSLVGMEVWGKVVSVYDGDTFDVVFYRYGTKDLMRVTIRAFGYDCSEMKPSKTLENREVEIQDAKRAKNHFIQLVTDYNINIDEEYTKDEVVNILKKNTKLVYIVFVKSKYGGETSYNRYFAELYESQKSKRTIGQTMINDGFAVSYDGKTAKDKTKLILPQE